MPFPTWALLGALIGASAFAEHRKSGIAVDPSLSLSGSKLQTIQIQGEIPRANFGSSSDSGVISLRQGSDGTHSGSSSDKGRPEGDGKKDQKAKVDEKAIVAKHDTGVSVDGKNGLASWQMDKNGNFVSVKLPDGETRAVGELVEVDGQKKALTKDMVDGLAAGNPKSITFSDGKTIGFPQDGKGNPTSVGG